ncbi:hypothetical protein CPI83_29675 (plasmid) [Rhodococcus sp. H-CA8f]|nr:hypothetical protein CPI83_29675 [Rhodococcus sp. H-CA8f]
MKQPVNTWIDENDSVAMPSRWSDPEVQKKLRIGGAGIAAVALVVGLAFGVVSIFSGDSDKPGADGGSPVGALSPQTPGTIDTSSSSSILGCKEIRSAEQSESSGTGDTESAEGAIFAYEHAFFNARDARQMAELSIPSPSVATEEQLANSILSMPVDTPWCVNITPTGEADKFAVAVRFVEADGATVTTWSQTMTVPKTPEGQWKITAVQAQ